MNKYESYPIAWQHTTTGGITYYAVITGSGTGDIKMVTYNPRQTFTYTIQNEKK